MDTYRPSVCDLLDLLTRTRALISDPSCWTAGVFARNAAGTATGAGSDDAVRFCAIGALTRTLLDSHEPLVRHASVYYAAARGELSKAQRRLGHFAGLAQANDSVGHTFVLRVYDDAIAALQNQCIPADVYTMPVERELVHAHAM